MVPVHINVVFARVGTLVPMGEVEEPLALLRRLKLGREEFCQRLITGLIVDAAYPNWNSINEVSERGATFLSRLYEASFGATPAQAPRLFVDEFELPARGPDEPGCAPDWAVLWPDRLWLIELKTEVSSHRPGQIPAYYALARHHHANRVVELTYVTPLMTAHPPALQRLERFAHRTWDEVLPIVRETWRGTGVSYGAVLDMLDEVKASFGSSWPVWREQRLAVPRVEPPFDPAAAALVLAQQTAHDGQQRALEHRVDSLEALMELRVEVAARLRDRDDLGPRVMAWLWNVHASTGRALSNAGAETGYELRLSPRGARSTPAGGGRRGRQSARGD